MAALFFLVACVLVILTGVAIIAVNRLVVIPHNREVRDQYRRAKGYFDRARDMGRGEATPTAKDTAAMLYDSAVHIQRAADAKGILAPWPHWPGRRYSKRPVSEADVGRSV